MTPVRTTGLTLLTLCLAAGPLPADDPLAPMKFTDVREVAPGVFFRYSSISATDKNVPFGGCNNTWVVFKDHVVVIDANFPREAADVLEAVKKTTDKPVRYVLDTHHHGDHAYGNAVWSKAGAQVVAQANCLRLLRDKGPKEFKDAGSGPAGRTDVKESTLKVPDQGFDDKLVLDDGTQRIEFYFLGHAHTPGDAFAYLPKHQILCTGDACVNGAFNFMGHSDSASWIKVMERAQKLNVKYVLPGHGSIATSELLEKQKRYFVDMRREVGAGIEAKKEVDDIIKGLDLPWYKEWTGVTPPGDNVRHVYAELTGKLKPYDTAFLFGTEEGPSPTKETPGWKKPRRIVVPNLMPARLAELKRVAPEVEFVPVKSTEEAARAVADADAVVGFCSVTVMQNGKHLRWVQVTPGGVDDGSRPCCCEQVIVTSTERLVADPTDAERPWKLIRENVRRFAAGEKLLCVVVSAD